MKRASTWPAVSSQIDFHSLQCSLGPKEGIPEEDVRGRMCALASVSQTLGLLRYAATDKDLSLSAPKLELTRGTVPNAKHRLALAVGTSNSDFQVWPFNSLSLTTPPPS